MRPASDEATPIGVASRVAFGFGMSSCTSVSPSAVGPTEGSATMPPPRRDMEQSNAVGAGLGQLILADWFAVARADIALSAGRIDEALVLAEQAVGSAEQVRSVFTTGLAHRVWAQALAAAIPPRRAEAEAHLEICLRELESGDARLPAAHAELFWARLCRRKRRRRSTTPRGQRSSSPRRISTTN